MESSKSVRWDALKAAFPCTMPILAGFIFLGFAYGLYMHSEGFSFIYPLLMAATIYGGSLEFIVVTMLLSPFAPLTAFIISLMVQARCLFYGLAMLKKYEGLGWKRFFLAFGLVDETFAINYTTPVPEGIDRGWFYLWITMLDYLYWVGGATLGGLAGKALPFDLTGLGFVMTTMFVVIFLGQLEREKKEGGNVLPAVIGFVASILCLLLFGEDNFLIPTLLTMLIVFLLLRGKLERTEQKEQEVNARE